MTKGICIHAYSSVCNQMHFSTSVRIKSKYMRFIRCVNIVKGGQWPGWKTKRATYYRVPHNYVNLKFRFWLTSEAVLWTRPFKKFTYLWDKRQNSRTRLRGLQRYIYSWTKSCLTKPWYAGRFAESARLSAELVMMVTAKRAKMRVHYTPASSVKSAASRPTHQRVSYEEHTG